MSTDNIDSTEEKSPHLTHHSTLTNTQKNDIEKLLDDFIEKNNHKSKVGHWLRDISPTSSPRSIIEKYYNENNPFALDEWTMHWGIDTHKYFSSLWTTPNTYTLSSNNDNEEKNWDYLDMRKKQNSDWAHEMTYKGVTLAKSNDYEKAIKVYNHAIEIDPECVDAYVAKGAAYANQEHYVLAIRNFEKALKLDPNCANAKKYLKATQNRKAEEDKIKEMERKKKEEEERIKKEAQSRDDIILDNSKLITSPLFMDMIIASPSRDDLKSKSKKKKRKSRHRSRSRNRKRHKRHHSSRSKSHRHSSSRKKRHSRHHSSRYSSDSSSSSSSTDDTSSSSDYSSDSSDSNSSTVSSRRNYSEDHNKKEKRSHHHKNDNEGGSESDRSDSESSDSDHRYHSSKRKRHSHHHHRSHSKRRRDNDDHYDKESDRESYRKDSYTSKHNDYKKENDVNKNDSTNLSNSNDAIPNDNA